MITRNGSVLDVLGVAPCRSDALDAILVRRFSGTGPVLAPGRDFMRSASNSAPECHGPQLQVDRGRLETYPTRADRERILTHRARMIFPRIGSAARSPAPRIVGGGRKRGYRAGRLAAAGPQRAGGSATQVGQEPLPVCAPGRYSALTNSLRIGRRRATCFGRGPRLPWASRGAK